MEFLKYTLQPLFRISQIVTIHYFEYDANFSFDGESHDFWEFLCVDKGEVTIRADENLFHLKKGDIIFHKPNQFHTVSTNGIIAPNLVVISFVCDSDAMTFFEDKILCMEERERNLLATIISEAKDAFSSPLNNPFSNSLIKKNTQRAGAEQMIQISLEQFLISLYRKQGCKEGTVMKSVKLKQDEETFQLIVNYMENHLSEALTIQQICHDNLLGKTHLQKLFRSKCNCGIMDYFSQLKISHAKVLIREKNLNFTQIADALGYTSIHYFSRQFKKISGMSPSEYALSIKALSDWKQS